MRTCRSNNGPRDRRGFESQSKAEWQKVAAWNPKTWQLEPELEEKKPVDHQETYEEKLDRYKEGWEQELDDDLRHGR